MIRCMFLMKLSEDEEVVDIPPPPPPPPPQPIVIPDSDLPPPPPPEMFASGKMSPTVVRAGSKKETGARPGKIKMQWPPPSEKPQKKPEMEVNFIILRILILL